MTRHTVNRVRYVAAAMAVVGLLVVEGRVGSPIAAAGLVPLPDCDGFCGPAVDCAAGCVLREGEQVEEITCGEYNGGAGNNQCNTCDFECTIWSPANQECWKGGGASDCETDGPAFAVCGDDICQNGEAGEGCDNCDEDCGPCPEIECPNSVCEPGETYVNCPEDCADPGSGGTCGDGVCSEDANEDYTNCEKDCVMPNERCDDNFTCGSGYTCARGGTPYGGQCLKTTYIWTLQSCATGGCPLGYICREVPTPGGPGEYSDPRCIWWYDLE